MRTTATPQAFQNRFRLPEEHAVAIKATDGVHYEQGSSRWLLPWRNDTALATGHSQPPTMRLRPDNVREQARQFVRRKMNRSIVIMVPCDVNARNGGSKFEPNPKQTAWPSGNRKRLNFPPIPKQSPILGESMIILQYRKRAIENAVAECGASDVNGKGRCTAL